MRRPTQIESCVVGSWLLLLVASVVMGFSSKIWISLLWAICGNMELPTITTVYFSSVYWFALIPILSGIITWRIWTTGRLNRLAPLLMVINHGITVTIAIFTAYAAIRPLLRVTFRIEE